jgi:putative DNA-invertase from lambdoid prophage Rac
MNSCAIYARVSTTDQDCEIQLAELRDYVRRRDWTIQGEYIDQGISGSKASRPALYRLMTDAAKRLFDVVLVWKLDRFGRSVLHLNQQLASLNASGVRFIAVSQALDTDASNPTSRLLLHILASVAEFEREMIRERTLSGVRAAMANGKAVGRPRRVFRRDEVRKLRDDESLSWREIARRLGVPVMTAVDAYKSQQPCTETVPPQSAVERRKERLRATA